MPGIPKIIAVASGKGGVGKSTVAVNLSLALRTMSERVGLLDADVYGPSLPLMLGLSEKPLVQGNKLLPMEKFGLKTMSMGLLASEDTPVIWRGPMVASILQQFLVQVAWGPLDYLVIDFPPGTGDAQLTIAQKTSIHGAMIVTTPQEVSLLDARRGLKMFQQVNVPVLGIVENMSYFLCDQCSKKHFLFSKGGGEKVAQELGLPLLGEIPFAPEVVEAGDRGEPIFIQNRGSLVSQSYLNLAHRVVSLLSSGEDQEGKTLHLRW